MRVGEASHPGPVQTRSAKRLESTQLDSDESDAERSLVHTQVDPDNISVVRSGRFSVLSSDRDVDSPYVQVCRAPTNVVDCGRVAVPVCRSNQSGPKRLRLSRNRVSQASTMPASEFDLTQAESDLEEAGFRIH